MDLKGKVIILTGARRIGQTVATKLAERGATLVLTYRESRSEANECARSITKMGRNALCVQADLLEERAIESVVGEAVQQFGGVDGFIHMASMYRGKAFGEITPENLETMMWIHVYAPLLFLQKLKGTMEARGGGAVVLFTAADALAYPYPGYADYHLAKSLASSLARIAAVELAPKIRVNAIAPGPILPPGRMAKEEIEQVANATPLKRWGGADVVAETVVFLLENDFITGQTIFVDGGRSLV